LSSTFAFAETLIISGKSHSLRLNIATINMSGHQVEFIFTTYDGNRYAYPYYYDSAIGMIHYSNEMKKIGSTYYTDYYSFLNGTIDDYGEIALNFQSNDSDNNGIDDICEIEKSVNTTVTGNWYSYTGKGGNISGTVIRNKDSQRGYFNLLIKNTWAGDIPATSEFHVGTLSGTATYSKATGIITVDYKTKFRTESPLNQLQTSFEVVNNDTVRIFGKDFFPTASFARSGNIYSATVSLSDGGFDTFWPDYQKWFIEIKDSNDRDKDGIPDFSDTENNRDKIHLPFLPLLLE
jgi:hypothetical protein